MVERFDRLVRDPVICTGVVGIEKDNVSLVDPAALSVEETQGNRKFGIQAGCGLPLHGYPESAIRSQIDWMLRGELRDPLAKGDSQKRYTAVIVDRWRPQTLIEGPGRIESDVGEGVNLKEGVLFTSKMCTVFLQESNGIFFPSTCPTQLVVPVYNLLLWRVPQWIQGWIRFFVGDASWSSV